jgi:hypothetical protein
MSEEEPTVPGVRVGGWVPPLTGSHPRTFPAVVPPPAIEPVRPPEPGEPVLIASHRRRTPWVGLAVLALIAAAGAVALAHGPEPRPRFALPGTVVLPSGPALSALPYLPVPTETVAATTSPPAPATTPPTARDRDPAGRTSAPPRTAPAGPRPSAPARLLTAGATVALQPVDRPGHRLRHRDFAGLVERVGPDSPPVDRADATFVVRAGLADNRCVSLESVNYPRHYLRHQDFRLRLHPWEGTRLYASDATFCEVRTGAALALRSVNYPDRYLTEVRSRVWLLPPGEWRPTAFVVRRPF